MHVDVQRQQPLPERLSGGTNPDRRQGAPGRYILAPQGHRVPVWVRVSPLYGEEGDINGAVEVFNDNSRMIEARQRIAELERLSMLDAVTRMPNRRFIQEQIISRLEEFRRLEWLFGVLFMALDSFDEISGEYGSQVGDDRCWPW